MKETVEDVQDQINELRSRMIDYEERITSPNLNHSISKMARLPQLKNEILMNNAYQGSVFTRKFLYKFMCFPMMLWRLFFASPSGRVFV